VGDSTREMTNPAGSFKALGNMMIGDEPPEFMEIAPDESETRDAWAP
jgi:hypothetical protein